MPNRKLMDRKLNLRSPYALRDKYYSMSRRERITVTVGLAALVIFVLFQFVFFPMSDKQNRLEFANKSKKEDLLKLRAIVTQYERLEANKEEDKGEKQGESFNLFAVLERLANQSGLMDNIDYKKPGGLQLDGLREEEWVEIKLSRITLHELTKYLYSLQSSENGIYIKRLAAKKEGEYLNLILQPAIIKMK